MASRVSRSKNVAKKNTSKTKKVAKNTKTTRKTTKKVVDKKPKGKNSSTRSTSKKPLVNKTKKVVTKKVKLPTVKKAAKVNKTAVKKGPLGYTTDQYQKFKKEKERLKKFSNQQLKDMLRKNLQSMSGNKDDLIYKVADGIVLGRIPRCSVCFGGRPKFDMMKGTYFCSGYRDDEDFHNCHTTFKLNEITRDPWEA